MAFAFRWLMRLFMISILLAFISSGIIYYLASRSLVDYNTDHTVTGISAPVEIVRDNADVPHIFGDNDLDVYFGLGFAHAQDRLWQMTMLRRTAQGKMSELFGERTVSLDSLIRQLDLYPLALKSVQSFDDKTRASLQAYSDGVNAWLTEINKQALGRGAPEFFFFSSEIAPWQPADSVALLKLLSLQMAPQLSEEVLRAQASLVLPQARVSDILPDAPGTGIVALPEFAALFPNLRKFALAAPRPNDSLAPIRNRGRNGASNAWAAAPSRSAAGGTLLANDPHMNFTAPSLWYLARMEFAQGGVIGATIPGIPTILSGRSDFLGWGITAAYVDDLDVYIEKLNPENPEQYLTTTGYKPFRTRNSIIQIAEQTPVTIKLRWTENGPVLSGSQYDLASITPQGHVASVAWTMLSAQDKSLQALMQLMQVKTIAQAIAAERQYVAPAFNLTLVDDTAIAMKTIGEIPMRRIDSQTKGRIPSPGWVAQNRWVGRMEYDNNPAFINPAGGLLGNTNNKTIDQPFPNHISYLWGDTQRILRWRRLMQSRQVHTRESFIEAQLDTVSYTARALLPLIAADLWFTGAAAPEGTIEQKRQKALELLANWNGEMNKHLPEPLIYAAWIQALQDRLIKDELGPLAVKFTHVEPLFIERVFRNTNGAAAWCDVIQSAKKEDCVDIARIAMDDAILSLDETYGVALEGLRWGDAHEAVQNHPVLGEMPIIKWFVNIRFSTSGGDNTLSRGVTRGTGAAPFENVHGAGYRGVYDFSDPDSSVFITSTGQSGHPLSRFYDNLGEFWRRGEYIPMSLDPNLARAAAAGITHLIPAQE